MFLNCKHQGGIQNSGYTFVNAKYRAITTLDLLSSVLPCLHIQSWAQLGCENSSSDGYLPWHASLFQASHFPGDSYPSSISSLYQKGPHFVSGVWHFIASEHTVHRATPVTQALPYLALHLICVLSESFMSNGFIFFSSRSLIKRS